MKGYAFLFAAAVVLIVSALLFFGKTRSSDIDFDPSITEENIVGTWEGYMEGFTIVRLLRVDKDMSASLSKWSHDKGRYALYHSSRTTLRNGYFVIDFDGDDKLYQFQLQCTRDPFNTREALLVREVDTRGGGEIPRSSFQLYRIMSDNRSHYKRIFGYLEAARKTNHMIHKY